MAQTTLVLIDDAGTLKKFLWVTVNQEPDGAVSVGLADRAFMVATIVSEVEVDGGLHTQSLDLTRVHGPKELTNPHFTFHPPSRMHLRANKEDYLLEQLVMIDLQLGADRRIPWLTFESKRVADLTLHDAARSNTGTSTIVLLPSSSDSSISLSFDLIASLTERGQRQGSLLDHVETWASRNPQSMVTDWYLHLIANQIPARPSATFTWHQQV